MVFAFDWPLSLFEALVRAVADVADAKVVHLEDGFNSDTTVDKPFWQVVGLLQLLRLANDLPGNERRFGEVLLRGSRVPGSLFELGAIDKCDAEAERNRWTDGTAALELGKRPEEAVLEAQPFIIDKVPTRQVWLGWSLRIPDKAFARFLAHGCVVPIGFRQRCLQHDAEEVLARAERRSSRPGLFRRRSREICLEVPRSPESALLEVVVKTLGKPSMHGARHLSVKFSGEAGRGPGLTKEFLSLAVDVVLKAKSHMDLGFDLWHYEAGLRTFWFCEVPLDTDLGETKEMKTVDLEEAVPGIVVQEMPTTERRAWRASLSGCLYDPGSCLLSCLLPSVLFGLNQERAFPGESCFKWFSLLVLPPMVFETFWYMVAGPHFVNYLEHTGHSDRDCRRISLSFDAFRLVAWVVVVAWTVHIRVARRAALRAKLNIQGSGVADCAAVTLCSPCALAQEAREIQYSFVPMPKEAVEALVAPQLAQAVVVSTAAPPAAQ